MRASRSSAPNALFNKMRAFVFGFVMVAASARADEEGMRVHFQTGARANATEMARVACHPERTVDLGGDVRPIDFSIDDSGGGEARACPIVKGGNALHGLLRIQAAGLKSDVYVEIDAPADATPEQRDAVKQALIGIAKEIQAAGTVGGTKTEAPAGASCEARSECERGLVCVNFICLSPEDGRALSEKQHAKKEEIWNEEEPAVTTGVFAFSAGSASYGLGLLGAFGWVGGFTTTLDLHLDPWRISVIGIRGVFLFAGAQGAVATLINVSADLGVHIPALRGKEFTIGPALLIAPGGVVISSGSGSAGAFHFSGLAGLFVDIGRFRLRPLFGGGGIAADGGVGIGAFEMLLDFGVRL